MHVRDAFWLVTSIVQEADEDIRPLPPALTANVTLRGAKTTPFRKAFRACHPNASHPSPILFVGR
ncbi:hypothetical protein Plim_0916 [Planctopirus limnophila DSM 3776]|uniref:Uncharacterized protein n=1 Tax=Planctopirus limnophila (strain ATCC 43296 / DSM 3776 / IFAM 1008 / Mu 290) TaxID=521674 RepID=D5SSL2_PLAL2|nr:hypothetical protein Plim_0916 [Planctopirus limnophila DSM 3776]